MSRHRSRIIAKRKKESRNERKTEQQRRNDLDRILKLMNLDDLKRRLSVQCPSVLARIFPKPRVIPDPASKTSDDLTTKCHELRCALDRVSIKVGHETLSFNDFFSIAFALYELVGIVGDPTESGHGRAESPHNGTARSFMERFGREMEDELEYTIEIFLAVNNRLNGPIYAARHEVSFDGCKCHDTTTLSRTEPESVPIEADGIRRRAFRCGAPADLQTGEIAWVSWDAQILGACSLTPYPVFIQSHAIEQAVKRLYMAGDLEGLCHRMLQSSLNEPRVIPTADGRFLVDVRLGGRRLGYLVAELLGDKVLVRTFLLPTMSGTPEAARLFQRLSLRRPDIEHLGLDDLRVLIGTDLLRDPEIAEALGECGCEDLLWFVKDCGGAEIRSGYADRFKHDFP